VLLSASMLIVKFERKREVLRYKKIELMEELSY
jgi:hypothetical protein